VKAGRAEFALACALSAWPGAHAAEPAAPVLDPDEVGAFDACAQRHKRSEILVDTASRRLYQTVCGAALWFDGLFGEGDLDAALKSYGHLEVGTAYSEFSGASTWVRLIARVKLPAMEERLSAFVGVDDEDAFARDRSEGQALRSRRRPSDRDSFLVGLGFAGFTSDRFQSDFKVGVRDVSLPQVFVQNRFNYIPYSGRHNRLILRITPFWNNRDRFGATTHTSFDHIIAEAFLLRWSTAATRAEQVPGVDWRSALILYHNLTGTRALAYELFIRGGTGDAEPLGEYGARSVLREPIFVERMFVELSVGYSWPRDDPALDRDGAADVGIGFEMPFGKAPK